MNIVYCTRWGDAGEKANLVTIGVVNEKIMDAIDTIGVVPLQAACKIGDRFPAVSIVPIE